MTTNAVYTAGPWEFREEPTPQVEKFSVYANGRLVTEVHESEANARLISAAPELLDALENLHNACEYWEDQNDPVLFNARIAIAKATGRSR
jgi:hypothetical protein